MLWRTSIFLVIVSVLTIGSFFIFRHTNTIDWEGNIFGVLAGGEGLAIRRVDTGQEFQAYLPIGTIASVSEGLVRIRGRLIGTSCAYANTVFSGQCVPAVDVDVILRP